jgi:hypothetical protein
MTAGARTLRPIATPSTPVIRNAQTKHISESTQQ